jgi:predicted dehydrogenase
MATYRAGILGLGRMGSTIDEEVKDYPAFPLPYSIAGACQASECLGLVAGSDLLPEKREAFAERWGVRAVYEDFREMIRQEGLDLVAICTKGENHAELAVAVAEAGVPMIYLEKAMACSMVEADKVLHACQANGVAFNTGVLRRFDNRYHKLRELIEQGAIGQPRAAVHYAGSSLLHGHIHSLDTILYLLGDPPAATVWGELRPRELAFENNRLGQDPSAIYHVEFEGGVEAWTVPAGNWDFEVIGTEGRVRMLNNGQDAEMHQSRQVSEKRSKHVPVPVPAVEPYSSTQFCLEDLVRAYETGEPSLGNVEVTHRCTEICFCIAESHRTGKRISPPLANRELYVSHV